MTDRVNSLTVVLEEDMRIDDVQSLIEAIRHFRNVLSVDVNISNIETHIAKSRAKHELQMKLWETLKDS